jgi:homoserine kinase type II
MAVYTFLSHDDISDHLEAHYTLGRLIHSAGITSGVENTNYRIDTDSGTYILTLFEKRVQAQDLPFFMGLNAHLKNNGLPTAAPVAGRDGQTIYTLKSKNSVVMHFLPGQSIEPATVQTCPAGGAALARLHLAGSDFAMTRQNAMNPPEWRRLIAASGAKADRFEPGLAQSLLSALDNLTADWNPPLPSGALHGDFFPDNVFFDGENTVSGIIDFYFACTGAFVYDLMLALHPWCAVDGKIDGQKARAFLSGYQSVRRLTADEIVALPRQGALAALRIAATRLYDALHTPNDAQVVIKDPMPYVRLTRWHLSDERTLAEWGRMP